MLMREKGLDLSTMQSYAVAVKECLRKTMLDQEIMFRKQVQELHRLYGMQKMLMEDIGLNQFDICTQSTWLFYSSNPVRRESSLSLIEGAKLSSTAMVFPDRHNGVYNSTHLNPLGLRPCSAQSASHVGQEVLNLSLNGGHEDSSMKSSTSVYLVKKDKSCTKNIFDLEVSSEGILNGNPNRAACAATVATITKCESQISVLSGKMENSGFPFDDAEYTPGFRDSQKAFTVNKSSLKDCISCEAGQFDLNQVQLDDSSCNLSDKLVTCHSTASSLHIFGISFDSSPESAHACSTRRKESMKSLNNASNILQWDDAENSAVMNPKIVSESTDLKCKGIKGCEAGLSGSEPVSRAQVGPCKDFSRWMNDPEDEYTRSTWELSVGQFTDPDATPAKEINCENTKDDEISCACQSLAEEKYEDGNVPSNLCDSICVIDSPGSMKDTHSEINLGDTSLIAPNQHIGTGDGNGLRYDCPKQGELPEVSMCIQTAAQLLINFSLSNTCGYQDCSSKAESVKVDKKEIEKIECSDSYEQIALELQECNVDDCSVSSKPYEIESTEKKDFSFRIKRGRRFKDFQKEILPGLASLSRHEIQEDINILEAVLRSREYRKIRARMDDHRSWCVPMKSRRSKRNHVRRKIF